MLAWLSVWSEMQTCICPSWCHCHSLSLALVKSRLVLCFWYWLTQVVPEKGPLNGCVCVCCIAYTFLIIYEKIHQFLLSVKRDAHERKLFPSFLTHHVLHTVPSRLCELWACSVAEFFSVIFKCSILFCWCRWYMYCWRREFASSSVPQRTLPLARRYLFLLVKTIANSTSNLEFSPVDVLLWIYFTTENVVPLYSHVSSDVNNV